MDTRIRSTNEYYYDFDYLQGKDKAVLLFEKGNKHVIVVSVNQGKAFKFGGNNLSCEGMFLLSGGSSRSDLYPGVYGDEETFDFKIWSQYPDEVYGRALV